MILRKDTLPKIFIILYLIIQVFSYTLSFLSLVYAKGEWQHSIIDSVYMVRNLSFYVGMVSILLFKRVKTDDFLLVIFLFLSYILMRYLFPQNLVYFLTVQPYLIYALCSYIYVRAEFFQFDELKKYLIWTSRVITVILIVVVLKHFELMISLFYMEYANAISIGVALLLYSGIIERKVIDLVISGVGLFMLLAYGSRGALLSLVVLLIYLLWLKHKNKKTMILELFAAALIVIFGPSLLVFLVKNVQVLGIDSRTIEKIVAGSFLTSNDRLGILRYLIRIISENLLAGTGLCGDRYYLPKIFTGRDATYAHNIFIELYIDYGIVIGSFVIFIMAYLIYKCMFKEKILERKSFFWVFFTTGFLQLLISRSWISEPNFFILFALLMTYSTSERFRFSYGKREPLRCDNATVGEDKNE